MDENRRRDLAEIAAGLLASPFWWRSAFSRRQLQPTVSSTELAELVATDALRMLEAIEAKL